MWSVIAIVAVAVVVATIVAVGTMRRSRPPAPPHRRRRRRIAPDVGAEITPPEPPTPNAPVAPTSTRVPPTTESRGVSPDAPLPVSAPRPDPEPMHGLDDALARFVDRSGATTARRLAAEQPADDLGHDGGAPLLERALDLFAPDTTTAADDASGPSDDRAG